MLPRAAALVQVQILLGPLDWRWPWASISYRIAVPYHAGAGVAGVAGVAVVAGVAGVAGMQV